MHNQTEKTVMNLHALANCASRVQKKIVAKEMRISRFSDSIPIPISTTKSNDSNSQITQEQQQQQYLEQQTICYNNNEKIRYLQVQKNRWDKTMNQYQNKNPKLERQLVNKMFKGFSQDLHNKIQNQQQHEKGTFNHIIELPYYKQVIIQYIRKKLSHPYKPYKVNQALYHHITSKLHPNLSSISNQHGHNNNNNNILKEQYNQYNQTNIINNLIESSIKTSINQEQHSSNHLNYYPQIDTHNSNFDHNSSENINTLINSSQFNSNSIISSSNNGSIQSEQISSLKPKQCENHQISDVNPLEKINNFNSLSQEDNSQQDQQDQSKFKQNNQIEEINCEQEQQSSIENENEIKQEISKLGLIMDEKDLGDKQNFNTIFIRHGFSEINYYNEKYKDLQTTKQEKQHFRYRLFMETSNFIDTDLHEYGRMQCEIKRERINEIEFTSVFVSPMQRAIQTAIELFSHHPKKSQITFFVHSNLGEMLKKDSDIFDPHKFITSIDEAQRIGLKFNITKYFSLNWQSEIISNQYQMNNVHLDPIFLKEILLNIFPQPLENHYLFQKRALSALNDINHHILINNENAGDNNKIAIISHSLVQFNIFKHLQISLSHEVGNVQCYYHKL